MSIVNTFFNFINKFLAKAKNSFNHLFDSAEKIMPFNQPDDLENLVVLNTEAFIRQVNIPPIFIDKTHEMDIEMFLNRGTKLVSNVMFKDIIQKNDTKLIQDFIDSGADVHKFSPFYNTTPLIEAAAGGYINSVRALIKAGANTTTTDTLHARTPLQWAFMHKHFDACKCLLDAMSPEQLDFQINYQPSRFLGLNTFIQTHQIEKLQRELSAVFDSENGHFSRLMTIPRELLIAIFSQNYPMLTTEQVTQNIDLMFNTVDGKNEFILPEATPEPVVFSNVQSTKPNKTAGATNNLKTDLVQHHKCKLNQSA